MLHRGGIVHPQATQRENADRGAPVALLLEGGSGGAAVHASPPYAAVAAQPTCIRAQDALPFAGAVLFDQAEGDV